MENLFTNGSEFKLPNGRRYRGYYHVHPKKGAMVGATHVSRDHDVLQPVNKLVKQKLDRMIEPSKPVVPPPAPVVPPPAKPQQNTAKPIVSRRPASRSRTVGY